LAVNLSKAFTIANSLYWTDLISGVTPVGLLFIASLVHGRLYIKKKKNNNNNNNKSHIKLTKNRSVIKIIILHNNNN
jgi:hypothetical protein